MASNDFLRSAMVNEDDLEAGFPGNGNGARVEEILRRSLTLWSAAAAEAAVDFIMSPVDEEDSRMFFELVSSMQLLRLFHSAAAGDGKAACFVLEETLPEAAGATGSSEMVASVRLNFLSFMCGDCGGETELLLWERDDRALETAESLSSDSSDLATVRSCCCCCCRLPLTFPLLLLLLLTAFPLRLSILCFDLEEVEAVPPFCCCESCLLEGDPVGGPAAACGCLAFWRVVFGD